MCHVFQLLPSFFPTLFLMIFLNKDIPFQLIPFPSIFLLDSIVEAILGHHNGYYGKDPETDLVYFFLFPMPFLMYPKFNPFWHFYLNHIFH